MYFNENSGFKLRGCNFNCIKTFALQYSQQLYLYCFKITSIYLHSSAAKVIMDSHILARSTMLFHLASEIVDSRRCTLLYTDNSNRASVLWAFKASIATWKKYLKTFANKSNTNICTEKNFVFKSVKFSV